jgi:hypothetical protein
LKPEQAVVILALIAELYATTGTLIQENGDLKALIGEPAAMGDPLPDAQEHPHTDH